MKCLRRIFLNLPALGLGLYLALCGSSASAQVCTFVSVAPAFGNYTASGPDNDVNGSITVTCVTALLQNVSYTIKLDLSSQAQGTQRRMASGGNYLNYNVFCDSAYSQIWADGTGSTCTMTGGQNGLLGSLITVFPIYGRAPRAQYVAPGTYTDSIPITVLY